MKYGFTILTVYNGYEPDNKIIIVYRLDEQTFTKAEQNWIAMRLYGHLRFQDGSNYVELNQLEGGKFSWINDEDYGECDSWENASRYLSALITHPDHYEETDIIEISSLDNLQSVVNRYL